MTARWAPAAASITVMAQPARTCAVQGCGRPHEARGLCHGHYLRWHRTGDVEADRPLRPRRRAPCSVAGCDRPTVARALCRAHYRRQQAGGDVRADEPIKPATRSPCDVQGCGLPTRTRGLCGAHATFELLPPGTALCTTFEQGWITHGYAGTMVPLALRHLTNGCERALVHRLVMAQLLGRPLASDESVHHRNGDRLDNRPENLELWSRWQPRGQRVTDKVHFALEVLRRYAPDRLAPQTRLDVDGDLSEPL